MTIKTKLRFAFGFLFAVILALGGLGIYYLNRLTNDSKAILVDNYETIEYVGRMQAALESRTRNPQSMAEFEVFLKKQEQNITEIGEGEYTGLVRKQWEQLKKDRNDDGIASQIYGQLANIQNVNMQAIQRKNAVAQSTSREALTFIGFLAAAAMLVAFVLWLNVPSYIANPIQTLTAGIKSIANRRYEERLMFKSSDEFGQVAKAFNVMATKLDEYEHSSLARLLFEKKRIETLIRNMDEAIVGIDENRRIIFANPLACDLLGTREVDLVNKNAADVATFNDLWRELIQPIYTENKLPSQPEKPLKIVVDGKESFFTKQIFEVAVERTGEGDALPAGYVLVLKNVTFFKELDVAKTNFIATVSHELKTPIASIKMSLKLLGDSRIGNLSRAQAELVTHLKEDATRLQNMTSELLNLTQVETGKMQFNFQVLSPDALVAESVKTLSMLSQTRGVAVEVKPTKRTLPSVRCDAERTTWVFNNLLSNAINNTPPAKVVSIELSEVADGVRFTFQNPTLVPAAVSEELFTRSYTTTTPDGTGIGLSIVKEIVGQQNGSLTAHSDENAFIVTVQLPKVLV